MSGVCTVVLLAIVVQTGCSNAQIRRTPVTPKPTPWFCEMNEARDDWQCVQNAELAANPKPARLPNDPVEPVSQAGAAAAGTTLPGSEAEEAGLAPLAAPGELAGMAALESAPLVLDDASEVLALPEDGFAVQLVATASREQADAFVETHSLVGTMTLQLARDADFYYVVLLGTYDTYDAAESAVDGRPSSLEDVRPWIRPLLSIQAGLLAARDLRAEAGG
ncbi:MAG: SPOR domain-containing protein [Pseudomonadales bacterium]